MFADKHRNVFALCIVVALAASACGSFKPPEDCGVGGTADEAKFARHFAQMELVNKATGQPGEESAEDGVQFSATDVVAIRAESLGTTSVRACVQERKGGGKIALDVTVTAEEGERLLPLGLFPEGSYVVRVIVDGTLVKNLTFVVQ